MKTGYKIAIGAAAGLGLMWLVKRKPTVTPSAPSPGPVGPDYGPIGTKVTANTSWIPDEFFDGIADMTAAWRAKGARVTSADFVALFNAESNYSPKALHGTNSSGYGGLNGMGAEALVTVGFPGGMTEYLATDIVTQLKYARLFLEIGVRNRTSGDYTKVTNPGRLYALNILPAYATKGMNFIVMYPATFDPKTVPSDGFAVEDPLCKTKGSRDRTCPNEWWEANSHIVPRLIPLTKDSRGNFLPVRPYMMVADFQGFLNRMAKTTAIMPEMLYRSRLADVRRGAVASSELVFP